MCLISHSAYNSDYNKFSMLKRTKYCGQISEEDIGKELILCGWVHRIRNHKVCESKEEKAHRQVVEGVFSWLKRFNYVSGWRKGITLLTYLYAYALGYSFFRKREVLSCA